MSINESDAMFNEEFIAALKARIDRNGSACGIARARLVELEERLGAAADACIVNNSENWYCKACGMELDTGGDHRDGCLQPVLVEAITDIRSVLKEIEV